MHKDAITAVLVLALYMPQSAYAWAPGILDRDDWGADESLGIISNESMYENGSQGTSGELKNGNRQLSDKEKKCRETVKKYPEDFEVRHTETRDKYGRKLVWPRRYSPKVKLIVIHHTGEAETGVSKRLTGAQKVRAIYKGHTSGNGWGDIGYHYLIDANGTIYEGRAGGANVVGAHVYCSNVGTIGIALIGNFLNHYPSEEQLKGLRWLLIKLSSQYGIKPTGKTVFHGKRMPAILTHRDLGPTQGPGRRIYNLMPKIRLMVARRDFTTPILPAKASASRKKPEYRIEKKVLPRRVRSRIRSYFRNRRNRVR